MQRPAAGALERRCQPALGDHAVVRADKSLARVERAFRSLQTVMLTVRPIFHWRERRVRAHLFVCLLADYLEWHMRQRLAPLLFAEEGGVPLAARPVAPAQRSPEAKRKDRTRETLGGAAAAAELPGPADGKGPTDAG